MYIIVNYMYFEYCIAENFQGRKLSRISKKWPFHGENFCGMLKAIISGHSMPKFRENFGGWPKITKFVNVFSLENFPLYGTCYGLINACMSVYIIIVHVSLYPSLWFQDHADIGTSTRQSHLHGVSFPVQPEAIETLKQFQQGSIGYVQLVKLSPSLPLPSFLPLSLPPSPHPHKHAHTNTHRSTHMCTLTVL